MTTLNIIGGGRVGKTLGLLWHQERLLDIQDVFCRTRLSSELAIDCIGAGSAVCSLEEVNPADIWLLSVPDDSLKNAAQIIAENFNVNKTTIFHTSGLMSSMELSVLQDKGAFVASVHPVKSFADPLLAAASFNQTRCAVEGDKEALRVLCPIFEKVGAILLNIDPGKKRLHHAATVMVSNFVVALTAIAQRCHEASGISSQQSMEMLIPLMQGTVNNLVNFGPTKALTGPVVRGDVSTVESHLSALYDFDFPIAQVYEKLTEQLIDVAAGQGTSEEKLKQIKALITESSSTETVT